jgi:hypothetical protein
MDLSEQFSIIQKIFTENGFTSGDVNVVLSNPSLCVLKAGESSMSLVFDEKSGLPSVTYSREIKIRNRVIAKPKVTRNLIGLIFYSDRVTVLIEKFPDFTLMYDEIGV